MQHSKQEVTSSQENEINLIKLFNFILEKKILLASLTFLITALSIIYVLNLKPKYQIITKFVPTSKISIANLNELAYTTESKESIFSDFLIQVSSQDVQKKIFIENDFLPLFNKNINPIDDSGKFISGIISSISVIPPVLSQKDVGLYLHKSPYSLSMKGSDYEVISKYLEALIMQADSINIMEVIRLSKKKVFIRLDKILAESSMLINEAKQNRLNQIKRIKEADGQKIREINNQINRQRYKAKKERLNMIVKLNDSINLAKSMGIIENNFKVINDNGANSDFTIAIGENKDLPEWYLYGAKALMERVEVLENRKSDDPFIPELVTLKNNLDAVSNNNILKTLEIRQEDSPFIPELVTLNIEKDKLKLLLFSIPADSSSIHIVENGKVYNISANKNLIVLLAFFGSFMMSLVLIFIMFLLREGKETPT